VIGEIVGQTLMKNLGDSHDRYDESEVGTRTSCTTRTDFTGLRCKWLSSILLTCACRFGKRAQYNSKSV
jgi:hypothetical protein